MELAILLSTYNGMNYLEEQVSSLLAQTYTDWKLYIRDDASTDNTLALIHELAKRDERIIVMPSGRNLGAKEGFMWMLRNVEADYYMFCDHDDVWLPRKVELTLKRMQEGEAEHEGCPVIACTNLKLVDAKLNVFAESYWKFRHYPMSVFNDKYYHLFYNNMPGCTMMLNQKAKAVCFPYSEKIVMHDAWFAIAVLWNKGFVVAEPESLMLYRQHAHNAVGAKKTRSLLKQMGMISELMSKTREQHLSTVSLTHMSFPRFVMMKIYYLLREHLSNFLGK